MSVRTSQIIQKATMFLHTSRRSEIQQALAPYGFTEQERAKGAALLMQVLAAKVEGKSNASVPSSQLLQQVDQWENRWYPIVEVVLEVHFPEVHQSVFHDLNPTSGIELVFTVTKMLLRVEKLGQGSETEQDALQVLEKHGFTKSVREEAEDLLVEILGLPSFPENEEEIYTAVSLQEGNVVHSTSLKSEDVEEPGSMDEEEYMEAVHRVSQWFRVWSTIARKAIQRKDYLVSLGVRKRARSKSEKDAKEAQSTEAAPATADASDSPSGNLSETTSG